MVDSKKRIIIENVNAEIKVFKILGGKYKKIVALSTKYRFYR